MPLTSEVRSIYSVIAKTGVVITKYPVAAAGTACTGSGNTVGAYKFSAAGANVKAIVAAAVITETYKVSAVTLDTPSATSIFVVRIGRGAAAGVAMTAVGFEFVIEIATDAGGYPPVSMPFPTSVASDANNGVLAEITSSNAGADDTAGISVSVATGIS